MARYAPDFSHVCAEKHDSPRECKYDRGADGCGQVGVYVFHAHFGENGRHARSAIGTNSLPLGLTVEIESVFEID